MSFTLAIIGRPNVGKSTLYNRLTGTQHAIVDDMPGVTRDRRIGEGRIGPMRFYIIDTAGLEEAAPDALETRMMQQTERAVEEADVSLMLIDGRAGVTNLDRHFAQWLRKKGRPVILVVNKCEGRAAEENVIDAYSLGLGDPVCISAAHGEGMGELYDALSLYEKDDEIEELKVSGEATEKAVQITIIGRPNVGKSTLINALLDEDRVLTGPEAGITRDSIAIDWEFDGQPIRLIDTAGVRRRSRVEGKVEQLSVSDTLRALRYAHVAVLLVDANAPLEHQELTIADYIIKEGRAVVLALNKWDTIENQQEVLNELYYKIEHVLPDIKGVPVVTLSALQGKNIHKVIKAALEAYAVWNTDITTHRLNDWLQYAESRHTPPLANNKRPIRLKFIKQAKRRPPAFSVFTNYPDQLPDSYIKYLVNSMREAFNLPGIPIRLYLRKGDNPYKDKKNKRS